MNELLSNPFGILTKYRMCEYVYLTSLPLTSRRKGFVCSSLSFWDWAEASSWAIVYIRCDNSASKLVSRSTKPKADASQIVNDDSILDWSDRRMQSGSIVKLIYSSTIRIMFLYRRIRFFYLYNVQMSHVISIRHNIPMILRDYYFKAFYSQNFA